MKDRPIGIFDSGLGGLTVMRSVIDRLPGEHIIYLGDDARGPYGPRDIEEVRQFSREIIDYLLGFDVKLVIIACNSATAAALDEAQRDYGIPIAGVIMPGARAALRRSRRLKVGVIGTKCTIGSGAYERALTRLDPRADVFSQACPEFVDFVERGEVTGDHISEVAMGYLEPMMEAGMDTLIMGCTHYPLLEGLLREVVGPDVPLVSSADETAAEVEDILDRLGWRRDGDPHGKHFFTTTGDVRKSVHLGRMFLGPEVHDVIHVGADFDEHPELDFESTLPRPSFPGGEGVVAGREPDEL
jgi:glutamate racemase